MSLKPLDFEKDILAALTDPVFWGRWGQGISPAFLSPFGQRVLRALVWCHRAQKVGYRHVVKPADLLLALRKDGGLPTALKDFAEKVTQHGFVTPGIQKALAEEMLHRVALDEVMRRGLAQQQTGKIDLDALAKALRSSQHRQDVLRDFDPELIQADQPPNSVLRTPWQAINGQIEGLRIRELGMILASPKVGKTKTLLNLAVSALEQKVHVLYVTAADIGYGDLCLRLAATWLTEPYNTLKKDKAAWTACQRDWTKLGVTFSVADYSYRPCRMLEIEQNIEVTRDQIGETARLAVFIDRLEDAIPTEKTGETRKDITENFAFARMLAARYAVPIWCDSQAALREGDQGWVDITRGAESRIGKAKVVDIALGVGTHPENPDILRVQIFGRRSLHVRRFELSTNPDTGVIYE